MTPALSPGHEPIAIIGLSCIFPGARDLATYWAEIQDGRNALGDIPSEHWSTSDYYNPDPKAEDKTYSRRGGFIAPVPFDPFKYGIVPNDLFAIDTTQILALIVADRALTDAGYGPGLNNYSHHRTSVILGVTGALKMVVSMGSRLAYPQLKKALADSGINPATSAEVLKRFAAEFTPWQENSFPGLLGNVAAGRIANRLNLQGSNLVVDAACASSLAAVRHGLMELRSGQADLVVTGGVDAFNDPFMYLCFSKTPALSPTGEVRPYDQSGDGTLLGEGVGVLVLKRLSEAHRDNDRIYAVIREIGSSSDGKGTAIFAPALEGQKRALQNTYESAGLDPGTVELVEGHGTGTAVGDAVEVEALTNVFNQSPRRSSGCPWSALGSVKAQIGHTKAAAGAAGLIKAALALYHKILPPAAKVKNPLPTLIRADSPFYLSSRPRPWLRPANFPRRAAVSAFGFGGSNFHALLEEAGPDKPETEPYPFELLVFSDTTPTNLARQLDKITTGPNFNRAAAETRTTRWVKNQPRLAICTTETQWPFLASHLKQLLAQPNPTTSEWPTNTFFGNQPAEPLKYGYLKPNSKSIQANLLLNLALTWPEMLEALNEGERELAALAPDLAPLSLILYPPDLASPIFSKKLDDQREDQRFRLITAQALNRGLKNILAKFDLTQASEFDPTQATDDNLVTLTFNDDLSDGRLDLAIFLGRLIALGLQVDLTAWPNSVTPLEKTRPNFTVMVSGANMKPKKNITPPSPPKIKAGKQSLLDILENLTSETARLHQNFLNQQAEALRLIKQEIKYLTPTPANLTLTTPLPELPLPLPPPPSLPPATISSAEKLLTIVSRETGYPIETLSLDLEMESDLGLDSIKKVEIMSVLSEIEPSLEALPAETLNNVITLRDLATLLDTPPTPAPEVKSATKPEGLWPLLQEVLAQETGYPKTILKPHMTLEADLGLDSIKVVEIVSLISERLGGLTLMTTGFIGNTRTLADLTQALEKASLQQSIGPVHIPTDPILTPSLPPLLPPQDDGKDSVVDLILEVIVQETGYPKEMLNLNLSLENDLGLDSIKKVEIISTLNEKIPLPASWSTANVLSKLTTLADLAALVSQNLPAPPSMISSSSVPPSFSKILLETIAQKTGYPKEMLNLKADLYTDLGLDSIKRVEIMSALNEKLEALGWSLPPLEKLNEVRTLNELYNLLKSHGEPTALSPSLETRKRRPGRPPKNSLPSFKDTLTEASPQTLTTQTLAFQVQMEPLKVPDTEPARPTHTLILADDGPLTEALSGYYTETGFVTHLTWLEAENWVSLPSSLEGLVMIWPGNARNKNIPQTAFRLLKAAAPPPRASLEKKCLSLVLGLTFMGGAFGFNPVSLPPLGNLDYFSAALAGLLKTAAREWPDVRIRVVDLPAEAIDLAAASYLPAILAATTANAPFELGLTTPKNFTTPQLLPYKIKNVRVRHLRKGQTIVVTGGARGITAAALKELARLWSPHLVIMGRTTLEQAEPEYLTSFKDESALRQAIWDQATNKPSPQELARVAARVLTNREIKANLVALEKAGSKVTYLSGDFINPNFLLASLDKIKRLYGPVYGLIHGAGVLADSLIANKKEADFNRVFRTKAEMAVLIMENLADQPLNLAVFFSSSTARFGRSGQADYAAGNEVLNKLAQSLIQSRPQMKCLSINWGPWAGGMVDTSLSHLFKKEGVGLIPLAEGSRFFATLAGTPKNDPVEVVVLGPGTNLVSLNWK
ncbi:MAG: hypothetical protein AMR96_00970 [Candidatus Adiutrix intracellularis]|nr:MAG: hypothetical protein AMR96_00970 [Candidatus Adiutrix intracellularis]